MALISTVLHRDFAEDHALYSEQIEMPDIDLTIVVHYDLYRKDDKRTRLNFNVNWMESTMPAENKQGMMQTQTANLELLKLVCENNPA